MGLYRGHWSIKEAHTYGRKFRAYAARTDSYALTEDKEYEIEIVEPILPLSPLCQFIDDKGKLSAAHLERFTKIEEIKND